MLISEVVKLNPEDDHYKYLIKMTRAPDYESDKDDGPEYEQLSLPLVRVKKSEHDYCWSS